MAIPTQFSVTNKRSAPIANPAQPVDGANPLTAEDVGFISGAATLSALAVGDITAPSELTSESAGDIDTPSQLTTQATGGIDSASLFSALLVSTISNPSVISAEPAAPVDSDINLVNEQAFNFTNTDNGWTIENGTITLNATSIIISNTTNDMRFIRESVDYNRESSYVVRVRVRCTTGNVSDTATLLYKNANHGYGPDYSVSKSVTYEQGVYQIIDFNMRGYDFSQFGADGIRLDLYNQAAPESFEIDYIHIGAYDAGFAVKLPKSIDAPSVVSSAPELTIALPSAATAQSEPTIDAPSTATAESEPSINTPSTLTANAGTQTSGNFPLNHARILYNNVLFNYTDVTVTNAQNGAFALTPNTWQKWTFTGGNTITIELPAAIDIDTICIGAHNLGSKNYTVGAEWSPDLVSGFTPLTPGKNPDTDAPLMFHLNGSTVPARRIKILLATGTTSAGIGYISAGISLQMQRPFFNGHTPITDGDVTDYYSNRTESGEIIGQQIRRKGFETSADWQNIDDTWYREYFAPFKQEAKLRPFFFAWNLLEYPNDVGFCRIAQDISAPMQNGTRTKRSISMKLLGAG